MTEPTYPVARWVATRLHAHWVRLQTAHPELLDGRSTLVTDVESMAALISAAFWTSLRREEGFSPRVSLSFVAPEQVERPLIFERPLPVAPESLTRLAPAVERPGIHLGVVREDRELFVWGATRNLPAFCFVLEVVAPGLLVIKQSRGDESGKFVNIAVIHGDEAKIIDQQAAREPDCPALLTSLLGFESQFRFVDEVSVLIQLAVSMRTHQHGGSLLVVPYQTPEWRESIAQPVTYSVAPPFSALSDLMQDGSRIRQRRRWQDALRRTIDGLAGLTAIDGATIITDRYELLAFGAKIIRRTGQRPIEAVVVTEPVEGARTQIMDPAQLGGTRHMSAAQFAHDQRDAIALVASQDGRFTVFAWSPRENMVHGHRIEILLL